MKQTIPFFSHMLFLDVAVTPEMLQSFGPKPLVETLFYDESGLLVKQAAPVSYAEDSTGTVVSITINTDKKEGFAVIF